MHRAWWGKPNLRGLRSRRELEHDLSSALSRHIGYTTAAYDIDRIVSTLQAFEHSPSAYIEELVESLAYAEANSQYTSRVNKPPSKDYLRNVVDFTEAMRLTTTVSDRSAKLRRFAPTEMGRALMGAKSYGDEKFYEYFLTKVVLLADSDALFPVLDFFSGSNGPNLPEYYRVFQQSLRERRLDWLKDTFTEPILLDRISSRIPWLSSSSNGRHGVKINSISPKTASHHTQPRKGWLLRLGLLIHNDHLTLTPFGESTRNALTENGQYFWLGPEQSTLDELGVRTYKPTPGPFEDSFFLIEEKTTPNEKEKNELLKFVAELMKVGYSTAKLVYAEQATLLLPIEYIRYRAYSDKIDFQFEELLETLFDRYRDDFDRLSAKRGPIGFYKWKARK